MAAITPQPTISSSRKLHSLKIDMTPMVDLGFLLITFFIFTTTLSRPGTTRLIMPREGKTTDVPASRSLTLLLDKEKAFVYEGAWEEAKVGNTIAESTYQLLRGLGSSIRQKQSSLAAKDDLIVLIKPLPTASYQNIITALDEMMINNVKKYAIIDASAAELHFTRSR